MKRWIAVAVLGAGLLGLGSTAQAGVFSDDLARCLVNATSPQDKTTLVVWIYSGMSAHPAIKAYSTLTPDQSAANTKTAADLFVRLLTVDCHDQTVAAMKNEGSDAMRQSFSTLGQVAMQQLMKDPGVGDRMGAISKTFEDSPKMVQLMKDAGVK